MTRLKYLHLAKEAVAESTTPIPGKISTANMAPAPEQAPVETTPAESNTVLVGEGPVELPEEGEAQEGTVAVSLEEPATEKLQVQAKLRARLTNVGETLKAFSHENFTPQDAELLQLALGDSSARLMPSVESFRPDTTAVMLRFAKEEIQAAIEEILIPEEGILPGDDVQSAQGDQQSLTELQAQGNQENTEQAQIDENIEQVQETAKDNVIAEAEKDTAEAQAQAEGEGAAVPEGEDEDAPAPVTPEDEAEPMAAVEEGEQQLDQTDAQVEGQSAEAEKVEKAVVTLERLIELMDASERKFSVPSVGFAAEAINRLNDEVCTEGKGKKATPENALVAAKEAHNRFTRMIAQIFDRIVEMVGGLINYIFKNTNRLRSSLNGLLQKAGSMRNSEVHIPVTNKMVAASFHGSLDPQKVGIAGKQGSKALVDVSAILKGMAADLGSADPTGGNVDKWFEEFKNVAKDGVKDGMILNGVFGVNLFQHLTDSKRPSLVASPIQLKEKGVTLNFQNISYLIGTALEVLDTLDKCKGDLTAVMRQMKNASRGGKTAGMDEAAAAGFMARARVMQHSLNVLNQALFGGAYRYATAVARMVKEFNTLAAVGQAAAAVAGQHGADKAAPQTS